MFIFLRNFYFFIVENILGKPISIRKTIFFIEWTILLTSALKFIIFHFALPDSYFDLPQFDRNEYNEYAVVASIFFCMVLSFFFPVNSNIWIRIGYIALEFYFGVVILGYTHEIYRFLVISKSYFLLSRRDSLIFIGASGCFYIFDNNWRIYNNFEITRSYWCNSKYQLQNAVLDTTISSIVVYLSASIFVVLFNFIILAEKKSRQRAEYLAQEVEILAANLERNRIAREIHDSLGHTLTALNVQLELAQNLRQKKPTKALEIINTVKLLADQCLQDVRSSVQTIRQSEFNLNEALQTLIENFKQNQVLEIETEINLPQLPLQTSHQLYCIVQEGLTNIQKHARASNVKLRGFSTPEEVILEIIDNGRGFDINLPRSGFGLRGMQERVQILNGEFKITSVLGKSTRIQVKIPL
jgi:signal transduction histidine kinase